MKKLLEIETYVNELINDRNEVINAYDETKLHEYDNVLKSIYEQELAIRDTLLDIKQKIESL